MSRTLIMACSATKKPSGFLIPALELYDGPGYRTLRANMPADLRVFILSAEHGLIRAEARIGDYDRFMTARRAIELAPAINREIAYLEAGGELGDEIFFFGGANYRLAITHGGQPAWDLKPRIRFSSGGIGDQLGQLKAWLRRDGQ